MILKILVLVGLLTGAFFVPAHAQDGGFMENNASVISGTNSTIIVRDREVSAANTAQTFTYDIGDVAQVLAIVASCSAGTATLVVAGSSDNANFVTVDSLSAAASNIKNYNNSTTGATTAVSPLAFRWLKITVGTCGASNTSTLTVAAK